LSARGAERAVEMTKRRITSTRHRLEELSRLTHRGLLV
jgi:hypothetical protein